MIYWKAALQSDLDRLKKLADRNLIPFNIGRCEVLQVGWNNPLQQGRLGLTGTALEEKNSRVLLDKLNMSRQCAFLAKGGHPHTGLMC